MTPADPSFVDAASILHQALEQAVEVRLDWRANEVIVIDNWRMLHAREDGDDRDVDSRQLQRILVR